MHLHASVECIELRVLPCPGGSSATVVDSSLFAVRRAARQGHVHAIEHHAFSGAKETHMALFEFSVSDRYIERERGKDTYIYIYMYLYRDRWIDRSVDR